MRVWPGPEKGSILAMRLKRTRGWPAGAASYVPDSSTTLPLVVLDFQTETASPS